MKKWVKTEEGVALWTGYKFLNDMPRDNDKFRLPEKKSKVDPHQPETCKKFNFRPRL